MPIASWSERMASSKGKYTIILFFVFGFLNFLVHFTYKGTGRISFSYLSLVLVFIEYSKNLTGSPLVGTVVFGLFIIVLFRGIMAMFRTRMQIVAWLLLIIVFLSALPIFDFRNIIL